MLLLTCTTDLDRGKSVKLKGLGIAECVSFLDPGSFL